MSNLSERLSTRRQAETLLRRAGFKLASQSEEHLLYARGQERVVIPLVGRNEQLHPKVLRVVHHTCRPKSGVTFVGIHYSATDETFYVGGECPFSRYYQSNSLEELAAKLERDGWSGPVSIGDAYGPPVTAWDRDGYWGGDWIGARLAQTRATAK
jgi:hypothetical protein